MTTDDRRAAHARAQAKLREREAAGLPARTPKPCGTTAAIRRHQRNPEKWGSYSECETCKAAMAEINAANKEAAEAS